MNGPMIHLLQVLAASVLAGTITARCISVVNQMHHRARDRHYAAWLLFGLAYSALALAALGAAVQVIEHRACFGDWLWLLASTGLIVFDRRGRVAT